MQWEMAYAHHEQVHKKQYCTILDIEKSGFPVLRATVPGRSSPYLAMQRRTSTILSGRARFPRRRQRNISLKNSA